MAKLLTQLFESASWRSRLPLLVAVTASLLVTSGVVYLLSVDVKYLLDHLSQLANPGLTAEMRLRLDLEIVAEVIKVLLDVYLLAVIALIVIGLYKLYAHRPGATMSLELAANLFLARTLESFKNWLIGVVLLRLGIKFFQQVLRLEYESNLDLVYLLIVILLIGSALYLGHRRGAARK